MTSERWIGLLSRGFFAAAFLLLIAAVVEKLANVSGYTLIGRSFLPSRLLELAGLLLLFVIALLLRSIRDEARRR